MNNRCPLISVLLPVYNAKNFLKETIDSILAQTYTNFELVIIDDKSTDNSAHLIESYHDKRIRFYRNKTNMGIAGTRNKLMSLAKGQYWALHDHDDISLPNRFEKQVTYLNEHPDVGAVSCWMEYFPDKMIHMLKENFCYLDWMKDAPYYPHPCAMLRADVFKKYNIQYDDAYRYCEDRELWFKALRVTKLAVIQEVLYRYRWDGSNTSCVHREDLLMNLSQINQKGLFFLTDNPLLQQALMSLLQLSPTGAIVPKQDK